MSVHTAQILAFILLVVAAIYAGIERAIVLCLIAAAGAVILIPYVFQTK